MHRMQSLPYRLAALLVLCLFSVASAQNKPATQPYYEESVAASNALRSEQAKELDAYILAMKADSGRLNALLQPDYSSPAAFEKSTLPYRRAFCDSIGYPPPGVVRPRRSVF